MRCERCGRENPEHLTFCEDCGYNLKTSRREPPVSRPTPSSPSLQRPQAPPLRLGERQEAPVTRSAQGAVCTVCQTRNQLGHRFCIACGSPLPAPAASPVGTPSVEAPSPPAHVPAATLAGAPSPVGAGGPPGSPSATAGAGDSMVTPAFTQGAPSFVSSASGGSAADAAPRTVPTGGGALGRDALASREPAALPGAELSGPVVVPPVPTASMSAPVLESPQPAAAPARPSTGVSTPLAVPSPLLLGGTGARGGSTDGASGSPRALDGSTTVVLEPRDAPAATPPAERSSERSNKMTAPDGVAAMKVREKSDSLPPSQALEPLPVVSLSEPRPPALAQQACPRCRTVSDVGTPFCRVCGHALAAPAGATTAMPVAPAGASEPGAGAAAPGRPVLQVVADGPEKVTTLGRIVQLSKDGSDGASHAIVSESFDLGSREGSVLLSDDPYVSPRHARLLREGGHWYVVDLDSVNGVYLRVQGKRALSDGDLILLGQQVLRFEVVMDAEHALRPAVQHGVALFGTPQLPRLARLAQRTVEGVTRDVYHLSRAETSLGRETADIVFSDDPFLSRRHAVVSIDRAATACSVEDQGSSNGTFVAIRGRERLTGGEVLRVGLHLFRVELAGSERGIHS